MYITFKCPCCLSQNVKFYQASLAQFVIVRATGFPISQDFPNQGLECNNCSFMCSTIRLSKQELENYYKDYNEPSFNEHRIQYDSYFKGLPEYYKTAEFYNNRMKNINKIINSLPTTSDIKNILDYGGNTGLYFPTTLSHAEKFLYDLTAKNLPDGIQRVDKNLNKSFDFIMCCHVLEHVSEPDILINEILSLSHKNTLFYIETPNGDLETGGRMHNHIFHEHINLFNIKSLTALLNRLGITVINQSMEEKNIGVLCTRQYSTTDKENSEVL